MTYTNEMIEMAGWFILPAVIVFVIGYKRCASNGEWDTNLLNTKIGILNIDGWGISHFLLHFVLGYRLPNRFIEATTVGVLWEGFEALPPKYLPSWFRRIGPCYFTDPVDEVWWTHKWTDIIMNTLGFLTGKYIRINGLPIPRIK